MATTTSELEQTKQEHAEFQSESNTKLGKVQQLCQDVRRSVEALEMANKTVETQVYVSFIMECSRAYTVP